MVGNFNQKRSYDYRDTKRFSTLINVPSLETMAARKIKMASIASVFKFDIRATPLPADPAGASEFYYALGVLTVAWGRLEGHFAFTLINLMRVAGANSVSHELPLSWIERARLWRKAFKSIPDLAAMKNNADILLEAIMDTAQDRHVLLHAMWENFQPDEPTRIEIVSVKHKKSTKDGLEFKRSTITLDMLQEITRLINKHNYDLATVSFYLASHYPAPEDARII